MPMLAASDDDRRTGARARPAAALVVTALTLAACASGPEPILYPNDRLQAVGRAQAEQEIAECRELAESAGASAGSSEVDRAAGSTVAGGAIGGASGAVG